MYYANTKYKNQIRNPNPEYRPITTTLQLRISTIKKKGKYTYKHVTIFTENRKLIAFNRNVR